MTLEDNLQTRSLIKKFMGTAGIQLISKGLSVVTGIILARVLGPEEFGRYGLIMSIVAMATIPTIAGMSQLMIREVSNAQMEKRWSELKGLLRWSSLYVITLSLIVMCALSISIYLEWIEPRIGKYLWLGLAVIPMRGLLAKQNAVLNGLRFPVLAQLPQGVISSVLVLIALSGCLLTSHVLEASSVLIIQIGASLGAVLLSGYLVLKKSPSELNDSSRKYKVKYWHSALLPFTLLAIISNLNNELASVMLGILGSEEAVGYFKVAMQGVALLSLGRVAINSVTGPNFARMYKQGNLNGMQKLLTRSVRLSAVTSIPFVLFLIFFGDWVVVLLFGQEYLPAAKLLTILCIGQVANVLMGSVGLVLQMTGNEKRALRILIITLAITILLLVVLIPYYQGVGAAISVTTSLILWNILMNIEVYKNCKLKCWIK
ncbi:flippase [Vibrio sp. EA2]|uniref:flippase n=1 Tax=Vibrio sp. EA2 TaxID=3079860 RepID=UPI002949ECB1|nr:flippase [Vibrio sp. EA2]MDV6253339.1 flippase [Vibrio sp. EA2]